MCGVLGIVAGSPVNQEIYDGLTLIQHRGQNAAGISTLDGDKLNTRKDNGLVRDVFSTGDMAKLKGNLGIGHVRYPTSGESSDSTEAQPFYVNSPHGVVMVHNGNLTNTEELNQVIFRDDFRHVNTASDSELLLNVFASELSKGYDGNFLPHKVFDAIEEVHVRCKGAYAVVGMIVGRGMFAFRDVNGVRPLSVGHRQRDGKNEYIISSETSCFSTLGFRLFQHVQPGEGIFIGIDGSFTSSKSKLNTTLSPCIFEYVYFARPDSNIDGISVYKARLRMGEALAKRIEAIADLDIDVVIPIPDTSRTSAMELAANLGVKYREGFIKNRYIGRTFIMENQKLRKKSVRHKLNAIDLEFEGKNVLLVDDSIVRGTTSKEIIKLAREAGAKKVFFASAAPAVRHPNFYGIDMPTEEELIAHGRTTAEICEEIGADWLIYQNYTDLVESIQYDKAPVKQFESSCFTGEYID